VLNEVSPLDRHALVKFTLLASVPSFASCGNDVRAVVLRHASVKLLQFLMSVVLKSLSDVQFLHALLALVTAGSSDLKLSSEEQLAHVEFALVTSDISPPSN